MRTREGVFLFAGAAITALVVLACATGTENTGGSLDGGEPGDASRDLFVVPVPTDSSMTDSPVLPPDDSGGCTGKVVINELKVAGAAADDEMIELFNPSSCAVPLGDWEIKYQSSAGGAGPAGYKFEIGASILANGYLVLTPNSSSTPLNPGMAANGQIALLDDTATIVDAVAYGAVTGGAYREGQAAPAPATGSIGRFPNGADTGNNKNDFKTYTNPSPNVANP